MYTSLNLVTTHYAARYHCRSGPVWTRFDNLHSGSPRSKFIAHAQYSTGTYLAEPRLLEKAWLRDSAGWTGQSSLLTSYSPLTGQSSLLTSYTSRRKLWTLTR